LQEIAVGKVPPEAVISSARAAKCQEPCAGRRVEPEPKRRRGIKVVRYDAIAEPGKFARLNRAVEQAKLKVPIAATFALAEAAKAHERLAEGHVRGKIVLRIRG
jgi:NADPH:quinone reductase-like Zn-dependent oxidoreductase